MAEFCVICAGPRTGTTFLENAVARAFGAAWPQEIFDERFAARPDSYDPPDYRLVASNFFAFRTKLYASNPELSLPSLGNNRKIYTSYMNHLRKSFREDRYLVDIKYTSWGFLDNYWRNPLDRPGLVDMMLADKTVRIVHLKRRNVFAQYCSLRLAEQSGLWWRMNWQAASPTQREMIEIDIMDCVRWMENMIALQQLFDSWFEGFGGLQLNYETLMTDGRFSPHVEVLFSEVFGRAPSSPLVADYDKVVPSLRNVIANGDRLLATLAGTRFEPMIRESLGKS